MSNILNDKSEYFHKKENLKRLNFKIRDVNQKLREIIDENRTS